MGSRAQREAARRRKSDWVKSLGGGGSKYPSKITWPELKCISTRRMRIVELSRSTSASIIFFVGGPKFIIFLVQHGRDGSQSSLFSIVDVLIRSGDIRDQTPKLFKIARTVDFG